jgi:menaquinone-dependent protoporphyrinogen oxidase
MADELNVAGHQTTLANAAENPPSSEGYDAVIVGGSVHIGKYQHAVEKFIRQNLSYLNEIPSAFFSVCLAITSRIRADHFEAEKITRNFLSDFGWTPLVTTQIAGAMKYTSYGFLKRMIMRLIAKREGQSLDMTRNIEYTDWNQVKAFALDFASAASLLAEKEKTIELNAV